jgi:hypothetical protein
VRGWTPLPEARLAPRARGDEADRGHGPPAPDYSFGRVAFPSDPAFTQLLGTNDHGLIAGYLGDGRTPKTPNKGFTLAPPSGFADENYPNSA